MATTGELMNLFRKFKLGASVFQESASITMEEVDLSKGKALQCMKRELAQRLADHIINHQAMFLAEDTDLKRQVSKITFRALVMQEGTFKTCVEAVIHLLTDEQIRKIREGSQINDVGDPDVQRGAGDDYPVIQ